MGLGLFGGLDPSYQLGEKKSAQGEEKYGTQHGRRTQHVFGILGSNHSH